MGHRGERLWRQLVFQTTRLSMKPLILKWFFIIILELNLIIFHWKSFALGLVLKVRASATQKWPVTHGLQNLKSKILTHAFFCWKLFVFLYGECAVKWSSINGRCIKLLWFAVFHQLNMFIFMLLVLLKWMSTCVFTETFQPLQSDHKKYNWYLNSCSPNF